MGDSAHGAHSDDVCGIGLFRRAAALAIVQFEGAIFYRQAGVFESGVVVCRTEGPVVMGFGWHGAFFHSSYECGVS